MRRNPFRAIADLYRQFTEEQRRGKRLDTVWAEEILTSAEAQSLLVRVGSALTTVDMEEVRQAHFYGLRQPSYEFEVLTEDLIRLCKFASAPRSWDEQHPFLGAIRYALRNLRFLIPNTGSKNIRLAELSNDRRFPEVPSGSIGIEEFGILLQRHAHKIVEDDSQNDTDVYVKLSQPVAGISEFDACVDYPTTVGEGICRLHATLSHRIITPRTVSAYRLLTTAIIVTCLTLATGPWLQLGDKEAYSGLRSFLLPMLGLLLSTSTLCSYIYVLLTQTLNPFSLATARTAAKSTAAILALFTIMFGLGLNDKNDSTIPVVLALLMFAGVSLTTIAADHMVNTADARINELKQSR